MKNLVTAGDAAMDCVVLSTVWPVWKVHLAVAVVPGAVFSV